MFVLRKRGAMQKTQNFKSFVYTGFLLIQGSVQSGYTVLKHSLTVLGNKVVTGHFDCDTL